MGIQINSDFDEIVEFMKNNPDESSTFEFKEKFPFEAEGTIEDKTKKEFLKDISAMVNADGGLIIYGIKDTKNIKSSAGRIVGVSISNLDGLKRRINSLIESGIEPYLRIECEAVIGDKYLLILKIPSSFNAPHWIRVNNKYSFHVRRNTQIVEPTIHELKDMFMKNQLMMDKLKNFRENQIDKIQKGLVPMNNSKTDPRLILHLIPLLSFKSDAEIVALSDLYKKKLGQGFTDPKLLCNEHHPIAHFNFDGLLYYDETTNGIDYLQLFRNGIIEAVSDYCFSYENEKIIHDQTLESYVLNAINENMKFYESINISPPIYVCITLINVKGFTFSAFLNPETKLRTPIDIDRDNLLLPEVCLESYQKEENKKSIRQLLDIICNACGQEKSINFDAEDNYIRKK